LQKLTAELSKGQARSQGEANASPPIPKVTPTIFS